ncbi:MAG TPA: pyridoxal-phosphate dependent enzyme [Chitinophagaceae bacterium]|nr:pyridoxal-phosphate dependent enzyme [Chitinophagaceae bacterium]
MQINVHIRVDELKDEMYLLSGIEVAVARLDLLHPVVSGNKYFKLKYNIENAKTQNKTGIITFGGAYSNHLAATVFACKEAGLESVAVVRGEKTSELNHTLRFCKEMGMQLEFVNRNKYNNKELLYPFFQKKYESWYLVPEGGNNEAGEKGCSEILSHIDHSNLYTHIICDIGSGATFSGIVKSSQAHQKVIGIVVLKGAEVMDKIFVNNLAPRNNFQLIHDYHFNGYAKKNDELISFMNRFYLQHQIPTDFVYTGKLFYALHSLITKNYFPPGSKILCMHTGGLQGNLSLPPGTLVY